MARFSIQCCLGILLTQKVLFLEYNLFIYCAALQCMICWTRELQISDHFSISCCLGMENLGLHEVELTNQLNAALEHSVTPTYQKGEMAIWAHEKIGMREVKIHSVLLRD